MERPCDVTDFLQDRMNFLKNLMNFSQNLWLA